MELESMRSQWTALNDKVEVLLHMNQMAMKAATLRQADTALHRFRRGIMAELIVNGIGALLLVPFIGAHLTEPLFLAPAVLLFVFMLLHVAFGAHQWITLSRLDFGGPVVQLQRALAKLRVRRIRVTKWTFWVAPLLWVPLLIVALKGMLRIDVYATFSTAWLIANLIFGVLVIVVLYFVSRHYADRMDRCPRLQRVMDDIAGHDLNAATELLNEVAQFEKEAA